MPTVGVDAPLIHLDQPESLEERQIKLELAQKVGARAAWQGTELFSIPPMPGSEPLRFDHLLAVFRQQARQKFIPPLALSLIQRKDLDLSVWPFNSQTSI